METSWERENASMQLDEALVRERAYALWLDDGAVHGRAEHYWFQAERELKAVVVETLADASGVEKPRGKRRAPPRRAASHRATLVEPRLN